MQRSSATPVAPDGKACDSTDQGEVRQMIASTRKLTVRVGLERPIPILTQEQPSAGVEHLGDSARPVIRPSRAKYDR